MGCLRLVELWIANSHLPAVVIPQDFVERLLNESTDIRSVMVDGRRFQVSDQWVRVVHER